MNAATARTAGTVANVTRSYGFVWYGSEATTRVRAMTLLVCMLARSARSGMIPITDGDADCSATQPRLTSDQVAASTRLIAALVRRHDSVVSFNRFRPLAVSR